MKPLIYIMSPYTKGDTAINVRTQLEWFHFFFEGGLATPIAPLMTHFLHIHKPQPYTQWIAYDKEIIKRCDAGFRANAEYEQLKYLMEESSGADEEQMLFAALEKPVFTEQDLGSKFESWVIDFHRRA